MSGILAALLNIPIIDNLGSVTLANLIDNMALILLPSHELFIHVLALHASFHELVVVVAHHQRILFICDLIFIIFEGVLVVQELVVVQFHLLVELGINLLQQPIILLVFLTKHRLGVMMRIEAHSSLLGAVGFWYIVYLLMKIIL